MKKTIFIALLVIFTPFYVLADANIQPTILTVGFISFGYDDAQVNNAQSFLTTQAGTISAVTITTNKVGTPTGTLTIAIEADSAGKPSGTPLGGAGTISIASLDDYGASCAGSSNVVTLASPATVADATTYWVTYRPDNTRDATNYLVGCGVTPGTYSDGTESYSNNADSWTNENADINFLLTINDAVTATPNWMSYFISFW